jgi:hypothetical protein
MAPILLGQLIEMVLFTKPREKIQAEADVKEVIRNGDPAFEETKKRIKEAHAKELLLIESVLADDDPEILLDSELTDDPDDED